MNASSWKPIYLLCVWRASLPGYIDAGCLLGYDSTKIPRQARRRRNAIHPRNLPLLRREGKTCIHGEADSKNHPTQVSKIQRSKWARELFSILAVGLEASVPSRTVPPFDARRR